ncbi:hypothetical protein BJ546DRAFT_834093 [Cryomyces antarcticus]|uniref:S-adenosylmethionine tRNA ribosyltransferase n=1 Tax=Cryomyces antarcticus TaxID=329879 RepID=A0ABR0LRU3_9PEZI|nr:hypothetical protein LTR16_002058 [Cryomyces antarcticus]
MSSTSTLVQDRLNELLAAREYPKTCCPSEVPRSFSRQELQQLGATGWRDLMPAVREIAFEMRDRGEVEIMQRGEALDPGVGLEQVQGPIRVRKVQDANILA